MELARAYVWATRALLRCPSDSRTEFWLISDTIMVVQAYLTVRGLNAHSEQMQTLSILLFEATSSRPADRDTCLANTEKIRSLILALARETSD